MLCVVRSVTVTLIEDTGCTTGKKDTLLSKTVYSVVVYL